MTLPNRLQGAFTGGELSPALWGRPDLAKYSIGAKELKNVFVHVEGGASNRSGTKYVFDLGEECFFVPFEFNDTQTYQLCFYNGYAMFLQAGETVVTNLVSSSDGYEWVESPTTAGEYYFQALGDADPDIAEPKMIYEDGGEMAAGTLGSLSAGEWAWGDNDSLGFDTIYVKVTPGGDPDAQADGWLQRPVVVDSPYAVEDLPDLRFSQQYDTLIFTCRGYRQRQLVRYGHDDWRWEEQKTVGGPLGPINADTSKVIDVAIENWSSDRNYTPGEVTRPASTTNATASWIGTFNGFESNSTINGDLNTSSIGSGERYYRSKWSNGFVIIYFPYTLIRIAKSSGLSVGDTISASVTFTETGGASSYSSSGIINKIYLGTTYDYFTVNFGWEYAYDYNYNIIENQCVPPGSECPDDPDGLSYWVGGLSEYQKRAACLLGGTDYSPQANGGGASISAVSGNVQKISGGATAYESISQSKDIEPGIDTDWELYWRALPSIPDEVINMEVTSSGHSPFTEDHVGMVMGLAEPEADRTLSYEWASNAGSTQYSDWIMVLGEVTMWTEGSWKGKVVLETSTDDGDTVETLASIHSKNQDHNGTLTREVMSGGTLCRIKFEPGGGVSATVKAYLRAESRFTHVIELTHYHSTQKMIGRLVYGDAEAFSTSLWNFGVFGEPVGWPVCSGIFEQRLFYGGTVAEPKSLWGSRTGNYTNFASSELQLATEPIALDISLSKQYEIRHLIPLKSLLILTSGSWHSVSGSDGALTPTNSVMTLHGYGGTSKNVAPLIVGLSVLCVQEDDRTVSELRYSLASDGYDRTEELGIMSSHLFRGKTITSWAQQKDPHNLIWVTLSDGTLLCFTFLREQEVWAWTQHETDGEVIRVGSNKSSAGTDDEVYFLVKRTINSQTRYFIEYLTPRLPNDALEDGIFMDCAVTYSGSPATTISGLSHLEGKTVAVLADGESITGHTVSGGEITLATAAGTVHVGLPYTARIKTLDLELGEMSSSIGRRKAVRRIVARVQRSKGFKAGPSEDDLTTPQEWDEPAAGELYSGDVDMPIPGDWGTGGTVVLEQSEPLPMSVNALVQFFESGE